MGRFVMKHGVPHEKCTAIFLCAATVIINLSAFCDRGVHRTDASIKTWVGFTILSMLASLVLYSIYKSIRKYEPQERVTGICWLIGVGNAIYTCMCACYAYDGWTLVFTVGIVVSVIGALALVTRTRTAEQHELQQEVSRL